MPTGKCPKCGERIEKVMIEPIDAYYGEHPHSAASYLCPACASVLGVGYDPFALKNLVAEQVAAIMKGRQSG